MMKASRYNIYDKENFSYVANTLTGAYVQVTKEELYKIENEKFEGFDIQELASLEENGLIVDSELDEMQLIRNAYNLCKYSNKKATITIALSLSCNFDCSYCYENKNNECMNEEVQNQMLEFLNSLLKENQIAELNVCWYGGEPTLYMDVLRKLSERIITVCHELRVEYHASIITNGYLVDNEMVEIFRQCLIRTAQVTLDGTEKTNDMRRMLINGKGTYERIKNSVFFMAEKEINVAVRVNLDKSNIHEYKDVCKVFSGKRNIVCYPAMVTIEETQDLYQKSLCFAHAEFEEFYDMVFEDVYKDEEKTTDLGFWPGICNCAAEHAYSYLITPDGYLCKCLNDICNSECAVGHVAEGIFGTVATAKYLGRDPFTEPECEKCPYIPVCYGGCVYEYKKHNTHACKGVKFMYKKYCQKIGGERYEGDY